MRFILQMNFMFEITGGVYSWFEKGKNEAELGINAEE